MSGRMEQLGKAVKYPFYRSDNDQLRAVPTFFLYRQDTWLAAACILLVFYFIISTLALYSKHATKRRDELLIVKAIVFDFVIIFLFGFIYWKLTNDTREGFTKRLNAIQKDLLELDKLNIRRGKGGDDKDGYKKVMDKLNGILGNQKSNSCGK